MLDTCWEKTKKKAFLSNVTEFQKNFQLSETNASSVYSWTRVQKAAQKCCNCLDVKENIQETTLDETWIDMEAEFPLISTPEALQELDWFMSENGYNEIATQIAQAMQDI